MEDAGTVTVRRPAGPYRDARRAYRVVVDGTERGTVRPGGSLEVTLAPGRHVVRAAIDWTGSPDVAVDLVPGGRVTLVVRPAGQALTALLQALTRRRYLALGPDAGG